MKKLLFCLAVLAVGSGTAFAQSIGILGGSTSVDWASDLDMTTEDGVIFTYEGLVIEVPAGNEGDPEPGVKFRQDDAWTINWGGTGFPGGTASPGGANIPATDGTYDVTFNLETLQYSFVPAGVVYDEVFIVSDEVDFQLNTADGIVYTYEYIDFPTAQPAMFYVNDSETGWGSSGFPKGTAVEGAEIPVLANAYNLSFNLDTKEYDFDYVKVSLVGTGVFPDDPNWTTDLDLSTTDGVHYTIDSFTFPGGEAKFRVNHQWTTAWGSTEFPSGTGSTAGDAPNIPITAGTWSVSFDRSTGAYSFDEEVAGLEQFTSGSVEVYPNPTLNVWNFTASQVIDNISVVDISGKVVYTGNGSVVDASGLASGIYFARVASGNAAAIVKVVKN